MTAGIKTGSGRTDVMPDCAEIRPEDYINTPWGKADGGTRIASGIVYWHTPGHGGYQMTKERRDEMHRRAQPIALVETFAGGNWYEQDCDANAIVLAFPEFFSAYEQWTACRSIRWPHNHRWHDAAAEYLSHWPLGKQVAQTALEWFEENKGMYERGGSTGTGEGVWQRWRRIDGKHEVETKHECYRNIPYEQVVSIGMLREFEITSEKAVD